VYTPSMPAAAPQTKCSPNPDRRDPKAHRAILDATVELLEHGGYKNLTIEAIAARAGVGKQTIYRWWSNKAALVMEAYIATSEVQTPESDTGNVIRDIENFLLPVFKLNPRYDRGLALANKSMMAEAQLDRAFHHTYAEMHMSWRGPLRSVFERAKARGELRPDTDVDALIDMILGAAWYRLLLEHAPLDAQFAHQIAVTVVEGNRLPRPAREEPRS
jgi:AcrR family transcriptional regulator